jgi:predicted carbohydrate-binding protein with CBM5 and CBM33 domain
MAPKAPNLGTGDENIGAVTMGSMAVAETYEGAEAFAASDSVAMTVRTRKAATSTTVAASMLTSRAPAINRRADGANARSSAVSAGIPVGSLAAAGQANSKIVLAQAESAVALSQTARGNADSWSIGQTG